MSRWRGLGWLACKEVREREVVSSCVDMYLFIFRIGKKKTREKVSGSGSGSGL